MGRIERMGSRRPQVERFVTLFPGRNSRGGVGARSYCTLSHCQGHTERKRVLVQASFAIRTPECSRDEEDPSGFPRARGSEQKRSTGLGAGDK